MSSKSIFVLFCVLFVVGFVGGTFAMLATKPEPMQVPAVQPAEVSFTTPTISVAGGRDIATCPDGFLLQYEELGGTSGGVICTKMTSPAD